MENMNEMLAAMLAAIKQLSQRVDELENSSLQDSENTGDLCITSLEDAMTLLASHDGPAGAMYRQRIVSSLINNNVRGLPALFHNFISSLSDSGDHILILQLCKYLLTLAPLDRDILADAILACANSCNWELGMEYFSKSQTIPKDRWNDKLFLYSGIFLRTRFNSYPNNDTYFEEAMSLAEDFIKYLRYDEHGYQLKASLYVYAQRRQDAMDFLLNVIRNGYSDEDIKIEKNRIVATQCCMQLLDLLDDTCDYDLIIEICDKGLRYTHDQVSARIPYFAYRRALAYDAKVYADGFQNKDKIVEALTEMQSAYTLVNNDRRNIANEDEIIAQKYEALRRYAGEKFVPLIKRSLTITENNE